MKHSPLIKKGLRGGFIRFEDTAERRQVYYPYAGSRFPLTPEEEVRIEIYLRLILEYNYPPDHLAFEHKVKMGSSYKYVDIVFYRQKATQSVQTIIECKRRDVSQKGFDEAIRQAKSYDKQLLTSDYLWVTSGKRNAYFRASHGKRGRTYTKVPNIPKFSLGQRWGQHGKELLFTLSRQLRSLVDTLKQVSIGKMGVLAGFWLVLGFFFSWGMAKLIVPFITSRAGIMFGKFHYGHLFWGFIFLTTFAFVMFMQRIALPNWFIMYRKDRRGRKRMHHLKGKNYWGRLIFAIVLLSAPSLLLSEMLFDYEDFCRRCCGQLWDCWWSERHYGSFDPSWRLMEFFIPFSFGLPLQVLTLMLMNRARRALLN